MSLIFKILIGVLTCGAAVSSAMAEGLYGAFDLGQSSTWDACTGNPSYVTGCNDTTISYRVSGGYQFSQAAGIEVSYADYGKESAGRTPFGTSADWGARGFQIMGVGTIPLRQATALLGKLGIAQTNLKLSGSASASATKTKPAFGIGVLFDLNQRFSARIEYDYLGIVGDNNTGTTLLTSLSIGLVLKF